MLNPPCSYCNAACCKQFGNHEYAVALFPDEHYLGEIEISQDALGGKALPYVNGKCIYLDNNDKCTIYLNRPQLCRNFNCCDGYKAKGEFHSYFLEDNHHVVELIEKHAI